MAPRSVVSLELGEWTVECQISSMSWTLVQHLHKDTRARTNLCISRRTTFACQCRQDLGSGSAMELHMGQAHPSGAASITGYELEEHAAYRKDLLNKTFHMITHMQHDVEDTLAGLEVLAVVEKRDGPPDVGKSSQTRQASPVHACNPDDVLIRASQGLRYHRQVDELAAAGDQSTVYAELLLEAAEQRRAMLQRATAVSYVRFAHPQNTAIPMKFQQSYGHNSHGTFPDLIACMFRV